MLRRNDLSKIPVVALLVASAMLAGTTLSLAAEPAEKSLYDRLGGIYPIASVVDSFTDILLVNDVLNANPAIDAARKRVPTPGLKFRVTALVCQATGGPCNYSGRSMKMPMLT